MINKTSCVNCRRLLVVLLFFSKAAFSQDTLAPVSKPQPVKLSFVRESDIAKPGADNGESIDSSLAYFHRTRDFLYDITRERNIFFKYEPAFFGSDVVHFSDDIMRPYKFSNRTIRYYNLNKRLTEVTYLLGAKKEQLFNIIYTQNLMKGWSAGLDFRRAGAEGFFQRQQFYQSSFDVFTHYESQNGKYNLYAYYLRNRLEQEENGGVRDFDPSENTVAQPTYLTTAENRQTDKEFLLRQFFSFGPGKDSADASINQSSKYGSISVGHSVSYESKGQIYVDSPSDGFYMNNFYDTTATADSVWFQRWDNKIIVRAGDSLSSGSPIRGSFTVGHEYFIFKNEPAQFIEDGRINQRENIYSELYLDYLFPEKILLSGHLRWIVAGDYSRQSGSSTDAKNDMVAYISLSKPVFNDKLNVFAEGKREVRHPDIADIRKYSNHFIWFNEFKQVNSSGFKAGVSSKDNKFKFSVEYSEINNMIYYDTLAMPRQFDESFNIIKLELQKKFSWRYWSLENIIEYQKPGNEDVIHLPEIMTGHSLSFEKHFFKSALLGRVGVDVRYVSSYYADRYMPALQEFYLQYSEKTAGYVLTDFFITFKIKSARFFAKLENALNGIYPEPKFSRPDYPLTPRTLRFGIQMRFYD